MPTPAQSRKATAASPGPSEPAVVQAELDKVDNRIRTLHESLTRAEDVRDSWLRNAASQTSRCNALYDEVQPLVTQQSRVRRVLQAACTTGLIGSGLLGLGPGLLSFSPIASLVVTAVDLAVLGGAILVVERSKKKLSTITPLANSLYRQWEQAYEGAKTSRAEASRAQGRVADLEQQLKSEQGRRDVLAMAQNLVRGEKPEEKVRQEDDQILIGNIRIPKRPSQSTGIFG